MSAPLVTTAAGLATVTNAVTGYQNGLIAVPNNIFIVTKQNGTSSYNWTSSITYVWDTIVQGSPAINYNVNSGLFTFNYPGTYVCKLIMMFYGPSSTNTGIFGQINVNGSNFVAPFNWNTQVGYPPSSGTAVSYIRMFSIIPVSSTGTTMNCTANCNNTSATFGDNASGFLTGTTGSITYYG
jgi:hypothetical protein